MPILPTTTAMYPDRLRAVRDCIAEHRGEYHQASMEYDLIHHIILCLLADPACQAWRPSPGSYQDPVIRLAYASEYIGVSMAIIQIMAMPTWPGSWRECIREGRRIDLTLYEPPFSANGDDGYVPTAADAIELLDDLAYDAELTGMSDARDILPDPPESPVLIRAGSEVLVRSFTDYPVSRYDPDEGAQDGLEKYLSRGWNVSSIKRTEEFWHCVFSRPAPARKNPRSAPGVEMRDERGRRTANFAVPAPIRYSPDGEMRILTHDGREHSLHSATAVREDGSTETIYRCAHVSEHHQEPDPIHAVPDGYQIWLEPYTTSQPSVLPLDCPPRYDPVDDARVEPEESACQS